MVEMSEEFDEMTEEESTQLNEMLSSTKDETVEFRDVEKYFSQLEDMFNAGKYAELLEHIKNALSSGEASLKKLQGIGLSLAILSSEKLIDSIKSIDLKVEGAEKLLSRAKRGLIDEMYEDATKAVWKLRNITPRLHEIQKQKLLEIIKAVESQIEELKRIGAIVGDVERITREAKASLNNDFLMNCTESLRKAQTLAEKARTDRITILNEAIDFVERLIEDAKGIGANIEAPLKHLNKAKSLFDDKDFQMCMYTTIQAEEMTTELIQRQVKRASALQKFLEDRYRAVATSIPYRSLRSEELTGEMKAEETEEKIEESQEPEIEWTEEDKHPCTTCGNPLEYIEQYKRWYCYSCQKYV